MSEQAKLDRGELTLERQPEERSVEESLRPQQLEEMIGQPRLRENLSLSVPSWTNTSRRCSRTCRVRSQR